MHEQPLFPQWLWVYKLLSNRLIAYTHSLHCSPCDVEAHNLRKCRIQEAEQARDGY